MSDFGANIFDEPPVRKPPAPPAPEKAAPAAEAAPVPDDAPVPGASPEPDATPDPAPAAAASDSPRRPADAERPPRRDDHRAGRDREPGGRPRREPEHEPRRGERQHDRDRPGESDRRRHDERAERPDRRGDRHGRRDHGAPRDRDRDAGRHEARPQPTERPDARTTQTAAASGQIAIFVDLDALRANAAEANVELAWNRLCRGLARSRRVASAHAYAEGTRKAPAGFEARPSDDGFAAGIELAAAAFAAAAQGQTVLLAPASPGMRALATALVGTGHAVELCGVAADDRGDVPVLRIGRDCLFVP